MVVCQEEYEFIGKCVAVVSKQVVCLLTKPRLVFIHEAICHKFRNLGFAHGKYLEGLHAKPDFHLLCHESPLSYVIR